MNFSQSVYEIVEKIPRGKVISYGEIARMLDNPRGARMVGWAMSRCPDDLPWHRVVMADGNIAGGSFAGLRREMLVAEDVPFLPDGRVDMKQCAWRRG